MKTTQELIAEYNALVPSKPLTSWKGSKAELQARIDKLNGNAVEIPAAQPETKETEMTKPSKKAAKKAPAKKAAKGKSANKPAAQKTDGVGAFVRELLAKDKGTKEIFDAAVAKGFETTYKSVASLVCRARKAA
jgi:hypothetical protein